MIVTAAETAITFTRADMLAFGLFVAVLVGGVAFWCGTGLGRQIERDEEMYRRNMIRQARSSQRK